jgi:CRISPR-associated endonuclease/helicase Cas3
MTRTLFAKSKKQGDTFDPPTVAEHSRDVREAAEAIWETIKGDLAAGLGADPPNRFRQLLFAAALLHDLAKINSAFQEILLPGRPKELRQPVRHEIFGAMLLADQDFLANWLGEALPRAEERWGFIWAIAGHHMKMGDPARGVTLFTVADAPKEVVLPLSDGQAAQLLTEAAVVLGVHKPPELKDHRFETIDDSDEGLEQRVARYAKAAAREWNRLRGNPEFKRQVALLKALLVAADVAASALTDKGQKPGKWVPKLLAARITPEILEPVIREGTDGNEPHDFQRQVGAAEKSATIVIAGTGNGKTTAAFLWAKKWAIGRKLFFTYPTTGTATAGYEDYLFEHRAIASALIHSRALVDLEAMRGSPEDKPEEEKADEAIRIESLQAWDRQAVVCTVDTVLGVMQNQKRSLYSFPAIAAGAFVFDEIHSYDSRLFGALLCFLQTFPGVPVLLMSASIPPGRMQMLEAVLGERLGPVIRGDPKLEGYKRYRLEKRDSAEACQAEVSEALRQKKKVLWVCNTVRDAIETARAAKKWAGIKEEGIIVYHSRFRYRDRVNRQKQVIGAFAYDRTKLKPWPRKKPEPILAITTQVCEMSLDISADLLVTAECPLPALVQRLGRLNRYADGDDPWLCLVYPFTGDPYNEDPVLAQTRGDFRVQMEATRNAVAELHGKVCSQADLAERLKGMADQETPEQHSAWLDGGWLTEPMPVREGDQSITVIWSADLSAIEEKLGKDRRKWTATKLVPWTIPMNLLRGLRLDEYAGPYPIMSQTLLSYCEKEGAEWVMQRTK